MRTKLNGEMVIMNKEQWYSNAADLAYDRWLEMKKEALRADEGKRAMPGLKK